MNTEIPRRMLGSIGGVGALDTGSLVIDKKRVGTGVDLYGAGPFTMQVACTYLKDGVVTPVTLPNGGVVVLDAAVLLLGDGDSTTATLAQVFGWSLALWGIGLYWWAGVLYAWQVRKLLATTQPRAPEDGPGT